jgi:hypothetical protein
MTMTSKVAPATLSRRIRPWLCAVTLMAAASHSQAISGITEPAHDFLPTFAGSTASADLDVVAATVTYNAGTDTFVLSSTMDGPIGSTSTGLYVWGVNRGAGVASFAPNGITGVRFDRVILLRADGTGSIVGVGNLPTGSVTVSGNTITAAISGASLPSTGFGKLDYTWNLWPRDTAFSGFSAISDFAPNNSNFTTTPVPEPEGYALMLGGLAVMGLMARRKTRRG